MYLIPTSLYIHIPWCVQKCPYCDFNSHTLRGDLPAQAYIDALLVDLDEDIARFGRRNIGSIFIGGGTPSLFEPVDIALLLAEIDKRLGLSHDIEITLEANPGTVEQARFAGFLAAGINRLSLGIQSLDDVQLKNLGRIHSAAEAKAAVVAAKQAGFENINLDLMFGLAKQTVAMAIDDLQQLIDLQPQHISWYQLTLEPNTLFYRHPPPVPNNDILFVMQEQGHQLLQQHGFFQYEVSAFTKNNFNCQHNMNYWQFGDYYGIGAGAHSKLTQENGICRQWKVKHPQAYLQKAKTKLHSAHNRFVGKVNQVAASELAFEFMLNALRLKQPLSLELFHRRTGLDVAAIAAPLALAQQQGFIEHDGLQVNKTELGERFLDDLVGLFLT